MEVYGILATRKRIVAICFEAEIAQKYQIMAYDGAGVILYPSFTFSEAGFWHIVGVIPRRGASKIKLTFVHCCTIGNAETTLPPGYGRSYNP